MSSHNAEDEAPAGDRFHEQGECVFERKEGLKVIFPRFSDTDWTRAELVKGRADGKVDNGGKGATSFDMAHRIAHTYTGMVDLGRHFTSF